MLKLAAILLAIGLVGARQPGETGENHVQNIPEDYEDLIRNGEVEIFSHDRAFENNLCKVLECKEDEVCLVKKNDAICLKTIHLHLNPQDYMGGRQASRRRIEDIRRLKAKHYERYNSKRGRVEETWQDEAAAVPKSSWKSYYQKDKTKTISRHRADVDENACSEKQMKAMGKRLVQWFGQIYRIDQSQQYRSEAEHQIACSAETGWMFTELDGNQDGQLDDDELESVENDPYEKCVRPFFDRCDQDADDLISMDEWCDCFTYTNRERDEPPCHSERHRKDPHLLGTFLPRCDADGYYRPRQCHERFCWCVDKVGREFPESKVEGQMPDCGQYEEKQEI